MANTFTVKWINRLDQLRETSLDLLITHDQGIIPDYRVTKSWQIDPNLVDSTFLSNETQNEIDKLVTNWNTQNTVEN